MLDLLEDFKYWLECLEIVKLIKACKSFYDKAEVWLQVPLKQKDIENCHTTVLKIQGWGRRVDRRPGENIELYRQRVLHALANAKSAGHRKGLEDILTRFGVDEFEILERSPLAFPDVVTIELPEGTITNDQDLLLKIFQEYGRTCRRYSQTVNDSVDVKLPAALFEHNQDIEIVKPNQVFFDEEMVGFSLSVTEIEHNQITEIVSL